MVHAAHVACCMPHVALVRSVQVGPCAGAAAMEGRALVRAARHGQESSGKGRGHRGQGRFLLSERPNMHHTMLTMQHAVATEAKAVLYSASNSIPPAAPPSYTRHTHTERRARARARARAHTHTHTDKHTHVGLRAHMHPHSRKHTHRAVIHGIGTQLHVSCTGWNTRTHGWVYAHDTPTLCHYLG